LLACDAHFGEITSDRGVSRCVTSLLLLLLLLLPITARITNASGNRKRKQASPRYFGPSKVYVRARVAGLFMNIYSRRSEKETHARIKLGGN